jgi:peptidyl-prolyl cis-trans isomerase B (cyclophilin B)
MRILLLLIFTLLVLPVALSQGYRPKAGETVLKMEIEGRGDVYVLLHTHEAPKASTHILDLARSGFYDGQRFHRVETSPKPYLVQVGDPASKSGDLSGNGGSGARIPFEESGFTNVEGAVGLSRPKNDREAGDSQFYLLLDRASFLDGNYTVFGKVVAGMDVLRKVERGDRVAHITILSG